MSKDLKELSPEAQELERLSRAGKEERYGVEGPVDLQKLITDRPDLIAGLNEFVAWREERQRAIAQASTTASVGHELTRNLAKLKPKKTTRKKK